MISNTFDDIKFIRQMKAEKKISFLDVLNNK